MARPPRREKNRDNARRSKKKVSALTIAKVDYVDYKDTDLLRKFVSDRAKIKARRVSGNDARQQRVIARAIKNAREMALIPYTSRVTTQRRDRRHDDSRQSSEESASSFVPEEENEEIEESYEEYLASDPEEQSDDKSELEVTE
ncbi:MAG: 30S ribosomal protein S18 [Acidimicrobiaceae bacterium]|jgi:small subunit ribosomal protein S18|nr:30S ribosomal protein S18 [Acidimicrobiaceae bacterium]MBO30421.1 30S ribosomal protein S18 [Acidimicrobiaceae bacterium]|tara:strand:- start:51 stop:482 length:432 start_codon:yes stop_codon:yes gene_type:complete